MASQPVLLRTDRCRRRGSLGRCHHAASKVPIVLPVGEEAGGCRQSWRRPGKGSGSVWAGMDRLGRWALVRRLGVGGMGEVFLGKAPDGSLAAIKVVRDEYATNASFRARFRREVEACSRVRGPRVAELVDAETDGPRPWLAVRYVPGPTLDAHVADHGPLDPDPVHGLAIGLADALSVVWSAGVVHRDLKPSNVILTAEGPVLIDFGVATATDATAITKTGVTVGSAGWIAPELLQGRPSSARSDVWGWAAVATFAAAGKGPHGVGPPEALAWRTLQAEPDPAALAHLPEPLQPVVERALAVDPGFRPDPAVLAALAAGQAVDESTSVAATRAERDAALTRLWNLPLQPSEADDQDPVARPRRRWIPALAVVASGAVAATVAVMLAAGGRDGGAVDQTKTSTAESASDRSTGSTPSTTAGLTTSTTSAPETTSTTAVVAERRSPDILLFEERLDAPNLFYNELLEYTGDGPVDEPENEAALLGSWYALADWCTANGHGRIGVCYDKAATFLDDYFDRDPRTINTGTWGSPGAIGGAIADAYDLTNGHLGINSQVLIPDLMPNRPGDALLCEPSCTDVVDS